ncbi:MAG: fasciclin domain-containing protein [Rhodospirillales bacterium]|nr:fasciclin domain-containing protein [Rhodospirillales bacterium]
MAVLTYHLVPGKMMYNDVRGAMVEVSTVQGATAKIDGSYKGPKINQDNIVAKDIEADNDVIHAIDAVILPPTNSLPGRPVLSGRALHAKGALRSVRLGKALRTRRGAYSRSHRAAAVSRAARNIRSSSPSPAVGLAGSLIITQSLPEFTISQQPGSA